MNRMNIFRAFSSFPDSFLFLSTARWWHLPRQAKDGRGTLWSLRPHGKYQEWHPSIRRQRRTGKAKNQWQRSALMIKFWWLLPLSKVSFHSFLKSDSTSSMFTILFVPPDRFPRAL